jgi:hypothetical protein
MDISVDRGYLWIDVYLCVHGYLGINGGTPTILRTTNLRPTILRTTNLRTTNPRRQPFSERPFSESDHSPNDQSPKTTNPRKTDYCQAGATMGTIFAMAKNREKNFYTFSRIFSLCCTWFFICTTGDRYLNIWIELCRVNASFTVLGLG